MKALDKFAEKHNLNFEIITYSFNGLVKKAGFDFIDNNRQIQVSIRPTFQREYKWFVCNYAQGTSKHIKTMHELPKLLKDFKPVEHTGYLLKN